MSRINTGRVILGGLLAGVVMNASEAALHGGTLAQDAQTLFDSFKLSDSPNPIYIVSLILATFMIGIAAVWLYAAMRPRFGPGPRTAIYAGLAVWVLSHVWSGIYLGAGFAGLIPARMAFLPIAWGFLEAPLGTLAGAWVYRE